MKKRYEFVAVMDYAEDGISIFFPDLPGLLPCADTTEEAVKNAKEALGLHLYGMEQDKEEIPEPSRIDQIKLDKNQVPLMVEVFMPAVRDRQNSKAVNKMITLPAWLIADADSKNVNYSRILQNALIDYLAQDTPTA